MKAKYLIRLDDACPTMSNKRWLEVEEILNRYGVSPLVGVVPLNRDPKLIFDKADIYFWDKVVRWQKQGWSIGLHGLHHLMRPTMADQILPFGKRSEFSGLTFEEQTKMIGKGYDELMQNGVRATAFIAPGHCFDNTTVDAVKAITPIRIISDGIAMKPYCFRGMSWIPVQLWRFRKMPVGIYTVCIHPNTMDNDQITKIDEQIKKYREQIIKIDDIGYVSHSKSVLDHLFEWLFWKKHSIKRI
jgi:predicted deacetylase